MKILSVFLSLSLLPFLAWSNDGLQGSAQMLANLQLFFDVSSFVLMLLGVAALRGIQQNSHRD